MHYRSCFFIAIILAVFLQACVTDHTSDMTVVSVTHEVWAVDGIDELLPGDILVRPNLNLLPGTAPVANGMNFGHAALVVRGYKHANPDSLLAGALIIESIAKDVPVEFQVRQIAALAHHKLDAFNNVNFDNTKAGNRFRLRLNLPQIQLDSVIQFAVKQQGDQSSWNAAKRLPADYQQPGNESWADNSNWYCSLLVWQSVLAATGIDLDPNGGYMVYPNDLISSPYFFNNGGHTGRAKF